MSSERSSTFIILIGLLTILFPALSRQGTSTAAVVTSAVSATPPTVEKKGTAQDEESHEVVSCLSSVLRPISEYFGTPLNPSYKDGKLEIDGAVKQSGIVIATVGDPIDSGLYYGFDQQLEGMRLAFGYAGYLRDRSWLPWVDVEALTAADKRKAEKCRGSVPGVIVFRPPSVSQGCEHDPFKGAPVLLFVVGETPTAGVHRTAFATSLELAASFGAPELNKTMRVIGPTFSGSVASLNAIIDSVGPLAQSMGATSFRFQATTASADSLGLPPASGGLSRDAGIEVSVRQNAPRDGALTCSFYQYLCERLRVGTDGGVLRGVALLVESATQYGANVNSARATCECDKQMLDLRPEITLSFPPHISSVRSAFLDSTSAPHAESQAGGDIASRIPATRLAPILGEPAVPRDIEPNVSNKTTSAHDLELASLESELSRQDVRYVGIIATDYSDVIFLAKQIRLTTPDVRLFTFSNDILAMHPAYASDLNGMMVVSGYPFFGLSEYGIDPNRHAHTLFSGDTAESNYNATVGTLECFGEAETRPFKNPEVSLPVWISVLGNGRLWPLAARASTPAQADVLRDTGLKIRDQYLPPKSWLLVVFLLAFFAAYNAVAYQVFTLAPASIKNVGIPHAILSPLRVFADCTEQTLLTKQRYYRFIALLSAAVAASSVLLAHCDYLLHFALPTSAALWTSFVLLLSMFLILAGTALVWWATYRAGKETAVNVWTTLGGSVGGLYRNSIAYIKKSVALTDKDNTVEVGWRLFFASLFAGLALLGMMLASFSVPRHRAPQVGQQVFLERLVHLADGVSPMVPSLLCCATISIWAICHLHRLHLLDGYRVEIGERPASPTRLSDPPSLETRRTPIARVLETSTDVELMTLENNLFEAVRNPGSIGRGYAIALSLILAAPFFLLFIKPPHTIELTTQHYVVLFAIALPGFVVGSTLVRLFYYWMNLQALLRRLARHPIAPAASRLPPVLSKSVEAQIAERTGLQPLAVPIEALRRLRLRAPLVASVLTEDECAIVAALDANALEATLQKERLEAHHGALTMTVGRKVHQDLVVAARDLVTILERFWVMGARQPLHEKVEGAAIDDDPLDAYTQFLPAEAMAWLKEAEEFVAMIVAVSVARLLSHFRHFVTAVTVGSLFLLLMITTYTFQPRRLLLSAGTLIVLTVVAAGIYIYVQLDRQEFISRIAKTPAGRVTLNRDFVSRVFAWGILPIVSVIVAQYPDVARGLVSWVEPLLH